ncbi:MAG: DNA-directed RNA polymerase subunit L [Candidatus Bathyarchaeota archaeon]|nr:DNA-directed RNA polymerase subunit L [Candidatus Bathyarchaeota archaeon]
MEVKKMDTSDEEIQLEVKGEGHTFCNALQNFLLKDPAIEFSGYKITHPLVGEPILNIRTNRKKRPEQSAMDAATALQKELEEIQTTFMKTIATEH